MAFVTGKVCRNQFGDVALQLARARKQRWIIMACKGTCIELRISFLVTALAVVLGAGSAAAADQNAARHHVRSAHRYPGGIAPGTYGYAPGYRPEPYQFGAGSGYTTDHDAWLSSGYW
jgi:hypothetical protein